MGNCCWKLSVGVGVLALVPLVWSPPDSTAEEASRAQASSEQKALNVGHPKAIDSIKLPNGNLLEIYDFGTDALVTETGKAYTAPMGRAYKPLIKAGRLAELHGQLQPDVPVPAAVKELQARLQLLPKSEPPAAVVTSSPDRAGGSGRMMLDGSCGNGCCDYDWIWNTLCSWYSGFDYSWFLFDYGYTWQKSTSIEYYDGTVCAATGTSTFHVYISSGRGGTWEIAEATYMYYWWSKGTWDKDEDSSVNSESNPRRHTYCGGVDY